MDNTTYIQITPNSDSVVLEYEAMIQVIKAVIRVIENTVTFYPTTMCPMPNLGLCKHVSDSVNMIKDNYNFTERAAIKKEINDRIKRVAIKLGVFDKNSEWYILPSCDTNVERSAIPCSEWYANRLLVLKEILKELQELND